MMDEAEILRQLESAFAEASMTTDFALTRDVTFEEIPGLDSISRVRLMLCVEEVLAVSISAKENGALMSVGDLIELIQEKQRTR
jgi:acyl carrier protein